MDYSRECSLHVFIPQVDAVKAHMNAHKSQFEEELGELRVINRELSKELAEKIRLLSKKTRELDEWRADRDAQVLELRQGYEEAVTALRKRVSEYEKQHYELESARMQEAVSHQSFIAELKSKTGGSLQALEARAKELRIENDRLAYKHRCLCCLELCACGSMYTITVGSWRRP